jgi:phosphomannomutase
VKSRPSLKIGISGVRGIAGEGLTPQLVTSFAAAFGTYAGMGPIVLGTDTRPSREMVSEAAIAGLLSVGCTPVVLGIVPVPSLQHHVRRQRAAGGICITGSHNPAEWNALKFFGPDGIVLRPNQFAELLDLYHQGVFPRVAAHDIPEVRSAGSAVRLHRESILAAVDVEAIRARRFAVVIDCLNGAASRAAPELLEALGCEVTALFTNPAAAFPREPELTPENLSVLRREVIDRGADCGFALDADADRLAVVDEKGEPLGEDSTVALAARHVLGRRPGPVVVSVSTSRRIDDVAAERHCPVLRTKVGETHVVQKMLECGAEIGGEGNGGVIAPRINPCRDGLVAMALILEALAAAREPLGKLHARIPAYAMVKEKLPCRPRDIAPALRLVRHLHREREIDLTDGVRVLWPDRWLHVRPSNTEPVLRVIAEAREEEEARALVRGVLEYLRPVAGF